MNYEIFREYIDEKIQNLSNMISIIAFDDEISEFWNDKSKKLNTIIEN